MLFRSPDYRKTRTDSHVQLLLQLCRHLLGPGQIPGDWVSARLDSLDRTDGDIDAYSSLGSADLKRGYYTQTVTMRSLATRQVFARWAPVGISCDQPRVFVFDPESFELEDSASGRLDRFGVYPGSGSLLHQFWIRCELALLSVRVGSESVWARF